MRSADRRRKCLLLGADRTYGGNHETDAFDPKQNWRSVEMQVSLHLTVIPWLLEFCRLRIDPGPEEDGRR
jgi:hypothetical protein